MNKILLKLVMLPAGFWRSLGADTDQLTAILTMRLLLDDRKPISFGRQRSEKKERKNGSIISALLYTFMGIMYAMPLGIVENRIMSLTFSFTLFFLMTTLTLITDFSSTLFDNRDKYILFPRPVNDRTLVLARLLHVFIYLLRLVVPMSIVSIVVLWRIDGPASALLFLLPMMLMTGIALFVVNSVYLIILQIAKPEKFKDIISYFQVAASVVFFAIFYLRPQMKMGDMDAYIATLTWMRFLPPYWLACFWSWVGFAAPFGSGIVWSIAGLLAPIVCTFILVRWLAPSFTSKISGIDSAENADHSPTTASGKKVKSSKTYLTLATIFNRSEEARAGFIIAWLQTGRSRTFRMRVYPSFAFIPIYFIFLLTQNGSSISEAFTHLSETPKFLILLYMSSYVLINGINYMIMSDYYKAAWVYRASPLARPGRIMIGALKAMWVKFFLPFFLLLAGFTLWIWGPIVITDIILALVNVTLLVLLIARVSYRQLPFSMMERIKQKGNRVIRSLITMFIPFGLGFGHYFAINIWWLKLTFLILSSILLWLVWDSYANTSWQNIIEEEENS